MDILDALRRPEGKTLEFKRDLSSPDGLLRTVVAFANTAGGIVLLGVEDGTRHVRGISDPLAVEERLANLISDSIIPRVLPDLEILPCGARRSSRCRYIRARVVPTTSSVPAPRPACTSGSARPTGGPTRR